MNRTNIKERLKKKVEKQNQNEDTESKQSQSFPHLQHQQTAECLAFQAFLSQYGLLKRISNQAIAIPLHVAASQGDVTRVRALASKEDHITDPAGQNALHMACIYGQLEVAKCLVEEFGYNPVEPTNTLGAPPLHMAVATGRIPLMAYFFIDKKIPIEIPNKNGGSPLLCAITRDQPLAVQWLLDRGARAPEGDVKGVTLLHAACAIGASRVVEHLISKEEKIKNEYDENGHTPFHAAIMMGKKSVVQVLLKSPKVDTKALTQKGETPFEVAVVSGCVDIAEELYEKSPPTKPLSERGKAKLRACFLRAVFEGAVETLKVCLKLGVEPNTVAQDFKGYTALHFAVEAGHLFVVEALLPYLPEGCVDEVTAEGDTALHLCADRRHKALARYLVLEAKADFMIPDKAGTDPLKRAIRTDNDGDALEFIQYWLTEILPIKKDSVQDFLNLKRYAEEVGKKKLVAYFDKLLKTAQWIAAGKVPEKQNQKELEASEENKKNKKKKKKKDKTKLDPKQQTSAEAEQTSQPPEDDKEAESAQPDSPDTGHAQGEASAGSSTETSGTGSRAMSVSGSEEGESKAAEPVVVVSTANVSSTTTILLAIGDSPGRIEQAIEKYREKRKKSPLLLLKDIGQGFFERADKPIARYKAIVKNEIVPQLKEMKEITKEKEYEEGMKSLVKEPFEQKFNLLKEFELLSILFPRIAPEIVLKTVKDLEAQPGNTLQEKVRNMMRGVAEGICLQQMGQSLLASKVDAINYSLHSAWNKPEGKVAQILLGLTLSEVREQVYLEKEQILATQERQVASSPASVAPTGIIL